MEHAADQAVLDDYQLAVEQLDERMRSLEIQLEARSQEAPYAEPVAWLRCFRGIDTLTAGEIVMAVVDLWTIGLAVMVVVAFFVFFRYSGMGLAMRAVAIDEEAAMARGISVRRVVATAWAISGAVAAIAGITLASGPAALRPSVGLIALAAFPAMILGGLDSPLGAVVGGTIIGLTQTLTAGYQPQHAAWLGEDFQSVTPYIKNSDILMCPDDKQGRILGGPVVLIPSPPAPRCGQ